MRGEFQSTLPARGATVGAVILGDIVGISIHAPREGSDPVIYGPNNSLLISIHAPREGSDAEVSNLLNRAKNFNPRSPRGERR